MTPNIRLNTSKNCTTQISHYSAIKRNEIMPFAAIWVDLEIIIIIEISQRKTNTVRYYIYVESKI